jgi:hypothetical protein
MTENIQRLKAEIIAALDSLPVESLKVLAEFVAFLRAKTHYLASRPTPTEQKPSNQPEDPILQLGTQPVVEDVSDASVQHDLYLYS